MKKVGSNLLLCKFVKNNCEHGILERSGCFSDKAATNSPWLLNSKLKKCLMKGFGEENCKQTYKKNECSVPSYPSTEGSLPQRCSLRWKGDRLQRLKSVLQFSDGESCCLRNLCGPPGCTRMHVLAPAVEYILDGNKTAVLCPAGVSDQTRLR